MIARWELCIHVHTQEANMKRREARVKCLDQESPLRHFPLPFAKNLHPQAKVKRGNATNHVNRNLAASSSF